MLAFYFNQTNSAYIAGSADGIVTVAGKPASRRIWLLNSKTLAVTQIITSLSNGHYMFTGLKGSDEYMVVVRDDMRVFEPFAWDYVKPANDLTPSEVQALWQTFQT